MQKAGLQTDLFAKLSEVNQSMMQNKNVFLTYLGYLCNCIKMKHFEIYKHKKFTGQ